MTNWGRKARTCAKGASGRGCRRLTGVRATLRGVLGRITLAYARSGNVLLPVAEREGADELANPDVNPSQILSDMNQPTNPDASVLAEVSAADVPSPEAALDAAFAFLRLADVGCPTIIDVGAHRGETLKEFAHQLAGDFNYIGLEPNPEVFAFLEKI